MVVWTQKFQKFMRNTSRDIRYFSTVNSEDPVHNRINLIFAYCVVKLATAVWGGLNVDSI